MEVIIDGTRYVPSSQLILERAGECIGMTLADCRKVSKWSLASAASQAGISKTYLWEIETGKATDPSFAIVVRLLRVYGINLNVLAGAVP
jgi:transcriptional regulator with XRE-family HTH domain